MSSHKSVARLDQPRDDRQTRQPSERAHRGQALPGPQHGLATRGPLTIAIDDVECDRHITSGRQIAHFGAIVRSPLERHEAKTTSEVGTGEARSDACAEAAVRVVEDREDVMGRAKLASHDSG